MGQPDPSAHDHLSLRAAAALAHYELARERSAACRPWTAELEAEYARALSHVMTIYSRCNGSSPARVPAEEVDKGIFAQGAGSLRRQDGETLTNLIVARRDVWPAIKILKSAGLFPRR